MLIVIFTLSFFIGVSVQRELDFLRKRFMSQGVTERELRDIDVEFSRQNLQLELCLLRQDVKKVEPESKEEIPRYNVGCPK